MQHRDCSHLTESGNFQSAEMTRFDPYFTVSVADVLSTGLPPIIVVEVVVNVPVHAVFGMMNGNEMDFEVPAFIVNGVVVNITVLVLAHDCPSGVVNVKFTLTVWAGLVEDTTVPVTVIFPPRATRAGLIPNEP
jgi:hypothetical protein